MAWSNHWVIKKNTTLQDINNPKNTITSKFKTRMRDNKILEGKRKLIYYKEAINPNLEDQNYLSVLTISKNNISISNMRMNSHSFKSK